MSRQTSYHPKGLARAAMEREAELAKGKVPDRRPGATRAMHVRPSTNGNTDLVDAETGELVSPCASPEIAERTRAFLAK